MSTELRRQDQRARRALHRVVLEPAEAFLRIPLLAGDCFLHRALFEIKTHFVAVAPPAVSHPLLHGSSLDPLCGLGIQPLPVLLLPAPAFRGLRRPVPLVPIAVAAHLPSVCIELDDRGGESSQERAVVGDRNNRPAVGGEFAFQPGDGVVVEVVGRLVQEQQSRTVREQAGQRQALLLTARE